VVGDPGVDVGGPVAAGPEGQSGGGVRPALLLEQSLVLGLVGDLGGQVFEHPSAQHPQLLRPEGRGLLDQVGLRLAPQVVTQTRRQRVESLHDHPGLRDVHRAGGQGVADHAPARVQRVGQRCGTSYRAGRVAGLVGQPAGGGPVAGGLGDVAGGRQHP